MTTESISACGLADVADDEKAAAQKKRAGAPPAPLAGTLWFAGWASQPGPFILPRSRSARPIH